MRTSFRIHEEEEIYVAVDARTESLQSLRELGPPDLVYLVKQPKANSTRQVRHKIPTLLPSYNPPCVNNRLIFYLSQTGVYHHVTGIDASSSASLAAYVNTLTFSPLDKTHKVVSGIYWLECNLCPVFGSRADTYTVATMHSPISICASKLKSPEVWRATALMSGVTSALLLRLFGLRPSFALF